MPSVARVAPFALLFAAFLALEAASFPSVAPVHSGDETVWGRVAQHPLMSAEFHTSIRPMTVPLIHKLAGGHEPTVVWLQSTLSLIGWFALALALAACFDGRARQLMVASVVCLFSLTIPVNQWDLVIRSESIFLSLLALTLALSLTLIRRLLRSDRPPAALLAAWAITALLFAGARDSGIYLLALMGAGLAAWLAQEALQRSRAGRTPRLHRGLALSLAVLAIPIVLIQLSTAGSARWRTPLLSVVLGRVLTNADTHAQWVERYAFPRNAEFERYAGLDPWDPTPDGREVRERLESDPDLADVERWLQERGLGAYQRWLVVDAPAAALTSAFAALDHHANHFSSSYAGGAGQTRWTAALSALLFPKLPFASLCWLALLCVGTLLAWRSPSARLLALATLWLGVNAWVQCFIGFHAASVEVPRHMLAGIVLLRLTALVALLACLRALPLPARALRGWGAISDAASAPTAPPV